MVGKQIFTYTDDDKIEAGPGTSEVSPEAKGDPLEQHFNCEEDSEHHVDDFQDKHQLLVVLQSLIRSGH